MKLHSKEINFAIEKVEAHTQDAIFRGKQYVEALVDQLKRQEKDELAKNVRDQYHQTQKTKQNV
jgi:hypothetical protein